MQSTNLEQQMAATTIELAASNEQLKQEIASGQRSVALLRQQTEWAKLGRNYRNTSLPITNYQLPITNYQLPIMRSQWECLLQNLGEWQGSFTRFSPQGELIEDTPTVVSFEGLNNNQTMRQIVRRFPANQPPDEKILEYSSLGRSILLFENGAFSNGSVQFAPFSEFGAELGLISGECRLRLVQLFNENSQLDRITLIRERLAGTTTAERPPLTVDDLVGEWQGEAVTIYPDWRSPDKYPTGLQITKNGENQISQQLTIYQGNSSRIISSSAKIKGSILCFDSGSHPIQVLLLPDGASSTSPQQIKAGEAFFLEVGWLLQPNLRQRLIRRYDDKGGWSSLTLVTEHRVG